MYCPKCGAQNIAEAKFCRLCGTAFQVLANPAQALPVVPNYGRAFPPLFIGIGFLIIAVISIFSHHGFFWWLIFPAISLLSKGMGCSMQMGPAPHYNALPQSPRPLNDTNSQQIPPASYSNVRARPTGQLVPPPSVTENTTRLLDAQ
jgi:hypothetical protein